MYDQILNWPWIKFVPAILSLLITLGIQIDDARSTRRKQGWFRRIGFPVLAIALMVSTCVIIWDQNRDSRLARIDAAKAKKDAADWQTQSTNQWSRIEGKLGDGEMAKRYLDAMQRLTQQYAAENTKAAITQFLDSKSEREQLAAAVKAANSKLLASYTLRMKPIFDYAVNKFDAWIEGVRTGGMQVKTTHQSEAVPVRLPGGNTDFYIRTCEFADKTQVMLMLLPAYIDDGNFSGQAEIRVTYVGPDQSGYVVWIMRANNNATWVVNPRRPQLHYDDFQSASENPIGDEKLLSAINKSLDDSMASALQEPLLHR